jgi:hypothetical protein
MEDKHEQQTSMYPVQNESDKALASIATLLRESTNTLPILRREFRGESLFQFPDGTQTYVQITKPVFVRVNYETNKPLKQKIKMRNAEGNIIEKEIYVPNDEAIEEVLSMLKFMGLNQVTLLTNIDEETILDDLKEFECKLAGLLCLKQRAWGIDKELLPMIQSKIKTIVQDARYQACEGSTLKAIQKTVQRVEQVMEGDKQRKRFNPYN